MYIGSTYDRKKLGFSCSEDSKQLESLKNFLKRTRGILVAFIGKQNKQISILIFSKKSNSFKKILVAVFIFVQSISVNIDLDVDYPSSSWSKVYHCCISESNNLEFKERLKSFKSPSSILDSILKLKGGNSDLTSEEQERLIKSILAKVPQSSYQELSINKLIKKILNFIGPVISDQRFWQIVAAQQNFKKSELDKFSAADRSTDILSLAQKQKLVTNKALDESKGSSYSFAEAFSNPVELSSIQKRVKRNMELAAQRKNVPTSSPTMLEASQVPTADMFSADARTGFIQDINIAFEQFQTRMIEIGNQYTDAAKQKYFLKLLDECSIDRWKALSTENSRLTIYGAREAESMLQSEFDGFHEPNSITRMTESESASGNGLDGRFRKGLLSGEPDTLNRKYTDVDVKVLVSEKTLHHQANERRRLGQKNPKPVSMYEQGEAAGSSIIFQKYKHCDPNKVERPSSPENVEHIVNMIELSLVETYIAKIGLLEGAKKALGQELGIKKESISDETAFQGILFLNENYTIERIN